MTEEIFGPILPVFPFKDIREVIKFINARDKPLAVYFFGNSTGANAASLCKQTSSGAFVTNEVITHINSHHMGFGGVGKSGMGRHGGYEGFKCFSNRKGILLKNPAPAMLSSLMAPPFGPKMEKFLRGWLVFLSNTNLSYITFYLKVFLATVVVWIYFAFFY